MYSSHESIARLQEHPAIGMYDIPARKEPVEPDQERNAEECYNKVLGVSL